MRPEWPFRSVIDLQHDDVLLVEDGNHGENRPRRDEISDTGRPHVRAADISDDGRIDFESAQRINDVAVARIRKGQARAGDVIVSHKGTVGRVALAPPDAAPFVCSPQTTLWRTLDDNQLDRHFLFAQLRSPWLQGQFRRVMHESDMAPYVSLSSQRGFNVLIPPIAEQRAIGSLLRALDDKIDCNHRLHVSGQSLLRADHANRSRRGFTDRRVLGDLVSELRRGIAPRYTDDATGLLVLNQRCVRDQTLAFGVARRHDETKRSVVGREIRIGDLLINSTGVGTLGRVAAVEWLPETRVVVDSHVTVVRSDPDAVSPWWLVSELLSRESDIVALAEGSTGQTELSRQRLSSLEVFLPPRVVQDEHADVAEQAAHQRALLARETQTLTAIRHALLPKLVSGQIRVPLSNDPEEQVGAAIEALI